MDRMRSQAQPPRVQTGEAASLLGVSRRMVQKLLVTGELAGARVGSRWTISPDDIAAYLAKRSNLVGPLLGVAPLSQREHDPSWRIDLDIVRQARAEAAYRRILGSRLRPAPGRKKAAR